MIYISVHVCILLRMSACLFICEDQLADTLKNPTAAKNYMEWAQTCGLVKYCKKQKMLVVYYIKKLTTWGQRGAGTLTKEINTNDLSSLTNVEDC